MQEARREIKSDILKTKFKLYTGVEIKGKKQYVVIGLGRFGSSIADDIIEPGASSLQSVGPTI